MLFNHIRLSQGILLGLSAAGIFSSRAGATELVGVDITSGKIYDINQTKAELTQAGNIGITDNGSGGGAGCLALGQDGNLYTITTGSSSSLYRINPATFAKTDVGSLGLSFTFEGGLAFSPGGIAYATNAGSVGVDQLFTVNPSTGAASVIGTLSGGAHDINGLAWRSDGTLVGIDGNSNSLVDINPATAAVTTIAALSPNLGGVGDLTTVDGTSYFATGGPGGSQPGSNELWTVNLFTGGSSLVGSFAPTISDTGISGLAADPNVPEPACLALMAVAIGLLALRRRRAYRTNP